MSAFNWRGPSILANKDKRMRLPVATKSPGPASQIVISTKTPNSINNETKAESQAKRERGRRAAI